MSLSYITIKVNGHDVKITTDQPITKAYLREIVAHIKAIEAGKK